MECFARSLTFWPGRGHFLTSRSALTSYRGDPLRGALLLIIGCVAALVLALELSGDKVGVTDNVKIKGSGEVLFSGVGSC